MWNLILVLISDRDIVCKEERRAFLDIPCGLTCLLFDRGTQLQLEDEAKFKFMGEQGREVMALSCPCWPSLAPAYLGWAGAMGAKTCHLGSNSGITGSCARSNFTHFGFDRFLAPLQIVNLHWLIGLPSQQITNTQQREFQDIRKIMNSE